MRELSVEDKKRLSTVLKGLNDALMAFTTAPWKFEGSVAAGKATLGAEHYLKLAEMMLAASQRLEVFTYDWATEEGMTRDYDQ